MYTIDITHCKNIKEGQIEIKRNKLNIKYGINGTGKTTIAKAIKYASEIEQLQDLKSYFSDEDPEVTIAPEIDKILVFDEDFVDQVVFIEDEVIENSFEIFIKTPRYDEKKNALDERLADLHEILTGADDIQELKLLLDTISKKFGRNASGSLKRSGTYKSILTKQNIYNVPDELSIYQTFFDNSEININWIDWKNKGDSYDIGDKCPYCAEVIQREQHDHRKQVFQHTYNKTDSKNLKEILELFESISSYLKEERYYELVSYIKEDTAEDIIEAIIDNLCTEVSLLINRFNQIDTFGRRKLAITDISQMESIVREMRIPVELFNVFGGERIESIFENINGRITQLLTEINSLKREMGELRGIMTTAIEKAQKDINEFLNTAGIHYELIISAEDEQNSRAILHECFSEDGGAVTKIRKRLSWGEKNAFALVLFMYYAYTQNPDLIILDDPISSFDSNKKYAIVHRIFKNPYNREVSFDGKTVLFLTHDFEPITDFLIVGKLNPDKAEASFIWNENREVKEKRIDLNNDIKLILETCTDVAKDSNVNIFSRITFLRKLCELNGCKDEWGYSYEILSCLIHGNEIRRKVGFDTYVPIPQREIDEGMDKIKEYITDFDFEDLKSNKFTLENLKVTFLGEQNPYFKIQIFREMKEIASNHEIEITPADNAWFKFIDETYHIENDYLHYLDVTKYNIVPDYILEKVISIVDEL